MSIVLANAAVGLLVAPGRTLAAWRAAAGAGSLFDVPEAYDQLLQLSVGELRALLGIPASGLAKGGRGLHVHAPKP